MSNATFEYMNLFRGYLGTDSYIPAALLVAETKEEWQSRKVSNVAEDRIYETMLSVADKLNIINPFNDKEQFERVYKTYCDLEEDFDWEIMMLRAKGYGYVTMSNALYNEYTNRFNLDADTVLIAEGEKFIPNLKRLVDEHPNCSFTITTEQVINFYVINRILLDMRMLRY